MARGTLMVALVLCVVGCDEPRGTQDVGRADGGTRDTGLVVDAGAAPDVLVRDAGVDAWVNRPDGGPGAGPCVIPVGTGTFGPIPSTCLPRCSSETGTAYNACTNSSCRSAAARADTTPGILYSLNRVAVRTPLDCLGCVSYAQISCYGPVCPSDVDAYVDGCLDAGGSDRACDAALSSLNFCLSLLTAEEGTSVDACIASDNGPGGCF